MSAGLKTATTMSNIAKCVSAPLKPGWWKFTSATGASAGALSALGKPYITLHGPQHVHALKEVDAAAMAWAETVEQVVETLAYVTR